MSLRAPAKKLLLAFASLFLGLGAGALAYEWFHHARYVRWKEEFDAHGTLERLTVRSNDDTLLWEYRSNGHFQDAHHTIDTNRWGFRDVDLPTKAKPAGVHRIAFAGDSVTMGFFVDPHETFVSQVNAISATRFPQRRVQAMNFGVDGYNALQVARLVRSKVVEFDPDRIVFVLCLNDFDFEDSSGEKMVYFKSPRSFLLRDLRRLAHLLRGTEFHRYHYDRTRDEVFDALLDLDGFLRARSVPWLVALVPVFPKYDPAPPDYFLHYPHASIHAAIVAFLERHQVPVLDLFFPIVATGLPPRDLSVDLWHPTPRGHRVIAEAFVQRLLERNE